MRLVKPSYDYPDEAAQGRGRRAGEQRGERKQAGFRSRRNFPEAGEHPGPASRPGSPGDGTGTSTGLKGILDCDI